jgi:hypothetical protein
VTDAAVVAEMDRDLLLGMISYTVEALSFAGG